MDIIVPLILGLLASGVIWTLAVVLDKKLQVKKELSTVNDDDLYMD